MSQTTAVYGPLPPPAPGAISLAGGYDAPARARRQVGSHLERNTLSGMVATDALLIVSELVTNSVVHANSDARKTLVVEVTVLPNHVRIAVTDAGASAEPRMLPVDLTRSGGNGLRLIDNLCQSWGVIRDGTGATRVWCELPLGEAPL